MKNTPRTQIVSRNQMVREIINEALSGQVESLHGLIDYLHHDLGYPLYRIAQTAERLYHLPIAISYLHIQDSVSH